MADSYEELSKLTIEVLKQRYDRIATSTQEGLSLIARREADAQNRAMLAFTKHVRDMTIAITVMTAVVLALTVLNVFLVWPK
jgi:hypothetical protein